MSYMRVVVLTSCLAGLAALITITVGLISYTIMTKKLDTTQQAHRALKEHCKTMKASLVSPAEHLLGLCLRAQGKTRHPPFCNN